MRAIERARPAPGSLLRLLLIDGPARFWPQVSYQGETKVVTAEAALGMVLVDLKHTAEASAPPVADLVVSVPAYFIDSQRRAVLDACRIAGLNCLRVMNDTTATALEYGIYKSARGMFSDKEPQHVMFIDMGHSGFQVSVVAFLQGKLHVLGTAWDRDLGGRDFDRLLADKFAANFKSSTGIDVTGDHKVRPRPEACAARAHGMFRELCAGHDEAAGRRGEGAQGHQPAGRLPGRRRRRVPVRRPRPALVPGAWRDHGEVSGASDRGWGGRCGARPARTHTLRRLTRTCARMHARTHVPNPAQTEDDFAKWTEPLVAAALRPIDAALQQAGLNASQLSAVEIVGGAIRMRAVKQRIAAHLGITGESPNYGLSTTLNMDECVARGCALQCAILSPLFKVRGAGGVGGVGGAAQASAGWRSVTRPRRATRPRKPGISPSHPPTPTPHPPPPLTLLPLLRRRRSRSSASSTA